MVLRFQFLLFVVLLPVIQVRGQTYSGTDGFISIDSGASDGYNDNSTTIPYTTDDQYIDSGTNYNVASEYIDSSLPAQYKTVRSFSKGDRNCYTLKPAIPNHKYFLRASFMYGNYDGNNSVRNNPLFFDLYIGVNLWKKVNISDASTRFTYEAITVALGNFVSICLIKTGSSIPFISLLEMRPVKDKLYPAVTPSSNFILFARRNFGEKIDRIIRYPDDPYDRIWRPLTNTANVLSTTSHVNSFSKDQFEAPSAVMQTAITTARLNESITFYWDSEVSKVGPYYYANLFFCELEVLSGKDVREFDVYIGGDVMWFEHYRPSYLLSDYIYSTSELIHRDRYEFAINVSKNSTLPPLINAVEVYSLEAIGDAAMTNIGDAEAMLAIKAEYQVKKNWMGDPCFPKQYAWDGVTCSNGGSDSRIITLNLSSSGLIGKVSASFSSLTAITSLDLSYNNLSGKIPDSLADISSLHVLILTGSCFTEIPSALINKSKDGSLTLRFDPCNGGSPPPDGNSSSPPKKISTVLIIVLSVVPAILLIVVVILIVRRIRRKPQAVNREVVQSPAESRQFYMDLGNAQLRYPSIQSDVSSKDSQLPIEGRQFMYTELENITKKFSRILGKGGFGTVFHGFLEDGVEVAVKICSLSSAQAPSFFLAEVENLSRVRHKNLVSLVGYCMDRGCMAVVYEYMPLGSLEDHLRGKAGIGRALSWAERLQIVLDAAQGLDYLYNGCPTPIVHRDVKTSNILLGQNLEAKVSDFGLSKAFHSELQTHVSMTALAFSPGYVDPMCLQSWQFSEKTDVYSFGVILLEIIIGEPPVRRVGDAHIIERAQLSFSSGNISTIVDARLEGMYNADSVWKVADLAMRCTATAINQRPKMVEVVTQLREIFECETAERSKIMTPEIIAENQRITLMKESPIFGPSPR